MQTYVFYNNLGKVCLEKLAQCCPSPPPPPTQDKLISIINPTIVLDQEFLWCSVFEKHVHSRPTQGTEGVKHLEIFFGGGVFLFYLFFWPYSGDKFLGTVHKDIHIDSSATWQIRTAWKNLLGVISPSCMVDGAASSRGCHLLNTYHEPCRFLALRILFYSVLLPSLRGGSCITHPYREESQGSEISRANLKPSVIHCFITNYHITQGLKTAHIYYLTVSVGQKYGHGLAGPSAS